MSQGKGRPRPKSPGFVLRVSAVTSGTGQPSVHGPACAIHATGRAFVPRNKFLAVKSFPGFFSVWTVDTK